MRGRHTEGCNPGQWLQRSEGTESWRHCFLLTETKFSSTKGVSMWDRMVTMMSLKSRPEIRPLLLLSLRAKACLACSNCSSWRKKSETGPQADGSIPQNVCFRKAETSFLYIFTLKMNDTHLWMYSKTLHVFSKSTFSWKYIYCMLFLRKKSESQNVNKKGGRKKKKKPLFTWKVSITENRVFFQCFKFLILKYVVTLLLEEVLVIPEHFLDYRWLSLSEGFMSLDSTNHSSNSNMKVMNNKLHKHCSSITLCGLEWYPQTVKQSRRSQNFSATGQPNFAVGDIN